MVAGAREGTAADAVAGVVPRLVLEPSSAPEAAEALVACARDRLRVAFVGGGTELELGAPPAGLDVVLRTTRLDRVVEHAPSDQIAVVEAGLPLAELQRRLAAHGQRLALDPPLAERATLGGIVAANSFGALRHRYGASRDLVIGMGFVRADGVAAKGGGKVVKNVAGFDVPRLLVGSLGTLALITTVTVRLHPLPEADTTVLVGSLAPPEARALVAAIRAAQLEPSAVVGIAEGGALRLGVRFEGFAPGVAEQRDRFLAVAERLRLSAEPVDDSGARAFRARHDAVRTGGNVRARLAAPPAALAELVRGALQPVAAALGGAALVYPTLGLGFVAGDLRDGRAGAAAAAVGAARAALAPLGGTLVVTAAPASLRAALDVWGPPPSSLALMRRVKDELDPDHRLAPGRFVGGI